MSGMWGRLAGCWDVRKTSRRTQVKVIKELNMSMEELREKWKYKQINTCPERCVGVIVVVCVIVVSVVFKSALREICIGSYAAITTELLMLKSD